MVLLLLRRGARNLPSLRRFSTGNKRLVLPTWQACAAVPIGAAAGFCTSVIGVGSAAVLVPALTLGLGLPQVVASSTGLAATLFGVTAGAAKYADADSVQMGVAAVLSPAAMLSSVAGARASARMSDRTLRLIWATLALSIAAASVKSARDVMVDAGQRPADDASVASTLVRRVSAALLPTTAEDDSGRVALGLMTRLERARVRVAEEIGAMRPEVAARHILAGLTVGFMNGLLGVSGTPIVMSYLSLFTDCTQHQAHS